MDQDDCNWELSICVECGEDCTVSLPSVFLYKALSPRAHYISHCLLFPRLLTADDIYYAPGY